MWHIGDKLVVYSWQTREEAGQFTVKKFTWDSLKWGKPLAAGKTGGQLWALTSSSLLAIAKQSLSSDPSKVTHEVLAQSYAVLPMSTEAWDSGTLHAAGLSVTLEEGPSGVKYPVLKSTGALLRSDGLFLFKPKSRDQPAAVNVCPKLRLGFRSRISAIWPTESVGPWRHHRSAASADKITGHLS